MKKYFRFISALNCFFFFTSFCSAQIITTFAGTGLTGTSGDGGFADTAKLYSPSGIAVDRIGNVYISDQNGNRIRKVNTAGIISTIVGTGAKSHTGDGGPATNATLYWPTGVTVDYYGNVYIADEFNNAVRKVDTLGIISTIAGTGTGGYFGDGGPATAGELAHPADVGVDTLGNVYIVDQDNKAVRKVDTNGIITTIAGDGTTGYTGDGGPATLAKLNYPAGISVDKKGNIFIADLYNSRVRKIDASGIISSVAGNGSTGYSGDGGPATSAVLFYPSAVATDSIGNIFITDWGNYVIRKVNTAGIMTTIAGNGVDGYSGDGGLATAASLSYPEGVAVDTVGNVYIADFSNARVRKVERYSVSLSSGKMIQSGFFSVFPNPSNGVFTLSVDGTADACSVDVLDTYGNVCDHSEMRGQNKVVNISGKPPGIYFVRVVSGTSAAVHKIQITR